MQKITQSTPQSKSHPSLNLLSHRISPATLEVIQRLLVLFAYGWWLVIIVYYGLFQGSISLGYQFQSFPIVVVSLALVQILNLSIQKSNHLLSALAGTGLLVSGLLA
jgi:hypothetical protein